MRGLGIFLLFLAILASRSLCSQTVTDFDNLLSNLPLLVIDTRGVEIPDDPKITAWLKIVDNGPGRMNNWKQDATGYDGYTGIELRGQSSQVFPKKSFSLELRNEDGSETKAALLGMPEGEDWVLYAPYSDKTLLRNAITYYLGSRMGAWQPRFRFCELYLNGEYMGVYALTEAIKRDINRVGVSKLEHVEISGDDLTGGYIIKSDKIDGLAQDQYFTIHPGIRYHDSDDYIFTYVYPRYDRIVPEQKKYIKEFLTEAENVLNGPGFSDPWRGFRKYFDARTFADYQIIQELTNNVDGYKFSTYFFKDKDSKGGKLHAGPLWDFDLAYGNEDYTDFNIRTDTWLYPRFSDYYGGRIHWWARMTEDLGYRGLFANRWKSLRQGPFRTDSVLHYLDSSVQYLGEAVQRNFERWPILGEYIWPNYFVGNTYEEETDYLKNWIVERMNWMDANITEAVNMSGIFDNKDILVYPNPARNRINLYFYTELLSESRAELFNLTGRKVEEWRFNIETAGYQSIGFDISLPPGYYILRLFQGNRHRISKKILVAGR